MLVLQLTSCQGSRSANISVLLSRVKLNGAGALMPEHYNAKNRFFIYVTGIMRRLGGKNKKIAITKKNAAKTKSRPDKKKRKQKMKCR